MVTCFNDLIGVEFTYGGRGPDAYDCWGLVKECYRRWHGVILPDYRSTSSLAENALVIEQEGEKLWRELPEIAPGSVLLIRIKGFGAHVGFAHSPTRFLQALEGNGVVESRVQVYRRQIIGAYEYAGAE